MKPKLRPILSAMRRTLRDTGCTRVRRLPGCIEVLGELSTGARLCLAFSPETRLFTADLIDVSRGGMSFPLLARAFDAGPISAVQLCLLSAVAPLAERVLALQRASLNLLQAHSIVEAARRLSALDKPSAT